MKAKELKKKYLEFFKKRGHTIIPSASLIPEGLDPSALFISAGMHPLVSYLLGQEHHAGKRLVNVQKAFRTDDINDVGDAWHNTFFEMLGNWSLGDYWKKEAIEWSMEFLTKELNLEQNRINVTVFGGDPEIPGVDADEETAVIWIKLGIPESRIFRFGKKDNWWGPVGKTGPCGPDTEMFYDTGKPKHGPDCKPGDSCGKYAEIWNDVFMEFNKTADGKYEPLKQKNVDTGMGVERTAAVLQGKDNVYDTELFLPIIEKIKNLTKTWDIRLGRIIADHLRAATFLINDGVVPGNIERGYVLRRLIRRAIRFSLLMGIENDFTKFVAPVVINLYQQDWPEIGRNKETIIEQFNNEEAKFRKTLKEGIKQFNNLGKGISGKEAFNLYQSYGFPLEMTIELAKEQNKTVDIEEFNNEFQKHQKISRVGMEKKFAGGLADQSEAATKGHTATHLLHQALRTVLGEYVHQTGSNITPERIRFDFSYGEKLTEEQIKKVEALVNQKIKEDLPVKKEIISPEEAKKSGAIGLFEEKYGDKVLVYSIGTFSKEICGGPHVERTGEIGKFKIIKEEALGSGQRRIRAVLI